MITSNLYVPDASVILKWVFDTPDEADRDAALMLLNSWVAGECEFLLPSLWLYEVGNIMGRNIPDKAPEFMEMLIDYRIEEERRSALQLPSARWQSWPTAGSRSMMPSITLLRLSGEARW